MSSSSENDRKKWRHDYFASSEVWGQLFGWMWIIMALVTFGSFTLWQTLKVGRGSEVIIYTSQDQQFAEPILREFTRQTGLKVRAIYDSEAVKTVALAQRLIAESKHPQCDVWWSNEALRTRQLARRGVLETNRIVEFGFRSRRMVINTNKIAVASAPASLLELTNVAWHGKIALAYPMFGTTSAQFIALRQHWGAQKWEQWCIALAANQPLLVDGNSVVVRLVGRGEAVVGLTDFDDVAAGQREGLPIIALPLNAEALLIPNSAAIVRGAPHAAEARQLLDYLVSEPVVKQLIDASALEGTSVGSLPHLDTDWNSLLSDLEPATEALRKIFLR
ncbi:MAG TPA: substrate-binding domain-containing protein [Candidatus Limnocylindria bacterium]|nr:substrate-binding domain-containing protein [Candidatus Limnocylindria bacterium]